MTLFAISISTAIISNPIFTKIVLRERVTWLRGRGSWWSWLALLTSGREWYIL